LRSRPVLAGRDWIVEARSQEITRWVARGSELLERALERATATAGELRTQLRALSPQATLDRGYAIAQLPDGHVLRAPASAPEGTELLLTLATGTVQAVSRGARDDDRVGAPA